MTANKVFTTSPPTRLCQLSDAEQLLVWSFRHRAFGGVHWQRAAAELCDRMALERAVLLLQALDRLVVTACLRGRRILTFHRLDCDCLGADELSLLTIVAAAQSQEVELAHATSRWLVQANVVEVLIEEARAVAEIFADQGWCLPLRQLCGPEIEGDEVERLLRRVLH